ncbi:DUF4139 domain-containing protein [Rhodovarius crocodyli]|uniref:DUF4139 domain-containing protein n=1 Tax=Rhodovarius crocodyli TaxID=1979269 RepID=A0A437MNL1_9PROT|nr:DUF4139 domain-containing protein [Rhodovarius crocodyli]RVT99200.1 DUF4139 domain-containing protein [Rhodovarius crocodyli]
MKRLPALILLLPLAAHAEELPVRTVTLSNAGLVEIQRAGQLSADGVVTLTIPTPQVDDILKSLLVLDSQGTVLGLSLPARELEEEAFRGLPLRPDDFADRLSMLRALRGQRVEVGGTRGLLIDAAEAENALSLTVLGERGLANVMLREGDALRLTDSELAGRVERAAAAMAAARLADTRRAEITFRASAARQVALAYVTAAPLWKPSWRLTLDGDQARLQGWAVVENRSGADWQDVRLSLVSGNPAAFAQALYTPIMRPRPEMPVRGAETIRPQADTAPVPFLPAPAPVAPVRPLVGGVAAMARAAPPPAPAEMAQVDQAAAESTSGRVSFTLPNPVSVRASETANFPFMDARIPAQRVWWMQNPGARNPLNAVRITNNTGNTLPDGLVSISGPAFLGDAELRAMPDGETRLLAHALDRDVTVNSRRDSVQRVTRVGLSRAVLTLQGEEEVSWALAVNPRTAGRLVLDMPNMPGYEPRFDIASRGDFGLRHEVALTAGEQTLRLPYRRDTRSTLVLWDPGLGQPQLLPWRGAALDGDLRRLPGGPGSLERIQEVLTRTAEGTPGRALLSDMVTRLTRLREQLDAARLAVGEAKAAETALERARAAVQDRTGAEREEARRLLNQASQAAERTGAAAERAWQAWQQGVVALLAVSG